jgi:hypothetical protein
MFFNQLVSFCNFQMAGGRKRGVAQQPTVVKKPRKAPKVSLAPPESQGDGYLSQSQKPASFAPQQAVAKKPKKAPEVSLAPHKNRGDGDFSQSQNPASSAVTENDAQICQSYEQNDEHAVENTEGSSLQDFIKVQTQVFNNINAGDFCYDYFSSFCILF